MKKGHHCRKSLAKNRGFGKKIKYEGSHIRRRDVSIEGGGGGGAGGFNPSAHCGHIRHN